MYFASAAADIVNENGAVLIPRESPIELVVRSVSYLGPGGVGMTLLKLDIDAVVVRDVRYPWKPQREAVPAAFASIVAPPSVGGREDAARQVVTRAAASLYPRGFSSVSDSGTHPTARFSAVTAPDCHRRRQITWTRRIRRHCVRRRYGGQIDGLADGQEGEPLSSKEYIGSSCPNGHACPART